MSGFGSERVRNDNRRKEDANGCWEVLPSLQQEHSMTPVETSILWDEPAGRRSWEMSREPGSPGVTGRV